MRLFSPDGGLWKTLDVLTDIFALSVLWLLCCIPVVTLGAATTALYDSVVRCVRYKTGGTYRRFFRTFKSDLGTSVLTTLFWAVVLGIGIFSLSYLRLMGTQNQTFSTLSIAYYVLLMLPVGIACWVFPILSRFTYRFGGLNITALRLAVGYLPRTVLLVVIVLIAAELCINFLFLLCFLPACMMLLWSLLIEPVFAKLGGGLDGAGMTEETESEEN